MNRNRRGRAAAIASTALSVCILTMLLPGAIARAANPLPGWLHKDGRNFTYWVPTKDWQAVETQNAIDITSPTGLYEVSYGFAPSITAMTPSQFLTLFEQGHAGDTSNWRILQSSPVTTTPAGTQRQAFEFTATHVYPLQGAVPIHGILVADSVTRSPGTGIIATVMFAPTSQWKKQASTLDRIRTNITAMNLG